MRNKYGQRTGAVSVPRSQRDRTGGPAPCISAGFGKLLPVYDAEESVPLVEERPRLSIHSAWCGERLLETLVEDRDKLPSDPAFRPKLLRQRLGRQRAVAEGVQIAKEEANALLGDVISADSEKPSVIGANSGKSS